METIWQLLDEPVKVGHLILLAVVFGVALYDIRKQMTAIGKSVWKIIDILKPLGY
jgi:hypothetical protein